jgi:hypothetical protein
VYTQLRQLRRTDSHKPIGRPEDYSTVRQLRLAPVAAIETGELAGDFPLVWRSTGATLELCALTSLTGRGAFAPDLPRLQTPIRPLRVEAYPLSLGPGRSGSEHAVLIDDVEPLDGAALTRVLEPDGSFSAEAQRRIDALKVFTSDLARTRRLTEVVQSAGLLVPWPVLLQVEGEAIEIKGLSIISTAPADQAKLPGLVEAAGYDLVELLTLHHLSLFNMTKLVDRHRLAPPAERMR